MYILPFRSKDAWDSSNEMQRWWAETQRAESVSYFLLDKQTKNPILTHRNNSLFLNAE